MNAKKLLGPSSFAFLALVAMLAYSEPPKAVLNVRQAGGMGIDLDLDSLEDDLTDAADTAEATVDEAADNVDDLFSDAADAADDALDAADEAVEDVTDAADEAVEDVADAAVEEVEAGEDDDFGGDLIEEVVEEAPVEDDGLDAVAEAAPADEEVDGELGDNLAEPDDDLLDLDAGAGALAAADPDDPMAKLQKLKQMLDMGLISQADFDTKKQEILNTL